MYGTRASFLFTIALSLLGWQTSVLAHPRVQPIERFEMENGPVNTFEEAYKAINAIARSVCKGFPGVQSDLEFFRWGLKGGAGGGSMQFVWLGNFVCKHTCTGEEFLYVTAITKDGTSVAIYNEIVKEPLPDTGE